MSSSHCVSLFRCVNVTESNIRRRECSVYLLTTKRRERLFFSFLFFSYCTSHPDNKHTFHTHTCEHARFTCTCRVSCTGMHPGAEHTVPWAEVKTWPCSSPLDSAVLTLLLLSTCIFNSLKYAEMTAIQDGCSETLTCCTVKSKLLPTGWMSFNSLLLLLSTAVVSASHLCASFPPCRLPLLSGCNDHSHYRKCASGTTCMSSRALFSCL